MTSEPHLFWLPRRPLALSAAGLPPLHYRIKTLVVHAQASIECDGGRIRVRASAKIPFKTSFTYECDVELAHVVLASGGVFQFSRFDESHGEGRRTGVAEAAGLRLDSQLMTIPAGVATFVTLAQAPYLLRDADDFERAYAGLLVGRHPHLVRFEKKSPGRYQIAALQLKHDEAVDPARLDWSRAHGAEIQLRDGLIDEIRVAIPLMGTVTVQRV